MSQTTTTLPAVPDTPAPLDAMMGFYERAIRDPDFDVNKLEVILRLRREERAEHQRLLFNEAMAAAQSEMAPVMADARNPHAGNRYASLDAVDTAIRPIYTRHGFSVRFGTEPSPTTGWLRVTCTLAHAAGHWETYHLDSPLDVVGAKGTTNKTAVQGVGSTVSYLRRYLVLMAFNVVVDRSEDDDGEGMRGVARKEQERRRPTVSEWLDMAEERIDEIDNPDELNQFLETKQVLEARAKLTGDARKRLESIVADAIARLMPGPNFDAPTTPEASDAQA